MKGGGERWTPQQLLEVEAGEDELSTHQLLQLQTLADCFLHWLVNRREMRRKDEGSETSLLTLFWCSKLRYLAKVHPLTVAMTTGRFLSPSAQLRERVSQICSYWNRP